MPMQINASAATSARKAGVLTQLPLIWQPMVGKTLTCTRVALVLGATTLVLPAPAAATLDPGINYDPGSPAGKEYAIPLVEGRAEGAGTTNQRRAADVPFGVGIKPPGASGRGGGGSPARPGSAGNPKAPRERAARRDRNLKSRAEATENPGGTAGRTLLLALAVLAPAALVAVLLQARRPVSRGGSAA
jgi:hypothetical protein